MRRTPQICCISISNGLPRGTKKRWSLYDELANKLRQQKFRLVS
jgi:hypothetical protein